MSYPDPIAHAQQTVNAAPGRIGRRAVLAGGLVAAFLPTLALAQQGSDPASQEPSDMKIRMTFSGFEMIGTLYDNASARDFFSMLPLELTIDDYGGNEKIAYLPRKLTTEGHGPFGNTQPGDIGYWSPWGNLALYHGSYRYDPGLVRLGRWDSDFTPLLTRGVFPLRIEAV